MRRRPRPGVEVDRAAEEERELARFNAWAWRRNGEMFLYEARHSLALAYWHSCPRRPPELDSHADDPAVLRRLAEAAPPGAYRDQALDALDRAGAAFLAADESRAEGEREARR
jgi:hypothetical protein